MADPEILQSPPKTGHWTAELKSGGANAKCFTNTKALSRETLIRFGRYGSEDDDNLASEASEHPLGIYGWISEVLLYGYSARRDGEIIEIYRSKTEAEQYHGVE